MLVKAVAKKSLGEKAGLLPGDRLLAINGHPVHDILDYRFHSADERLLVEVAAPDSTVRTLVITKHPDRDLGLSLSEDKIRICKNFCPFCFVHQNPKGLRRTLYIKDDDYRLSFLHGDFITLTNLTEDDFQRILNYRLSPLYVSVHTTDEGLRKKVLGNPKAPLLWPQMKRLMEAGIILHTQVVLCPGLNDGAFLEKTIRDLAHFYPKIPSLAVVPVGLTQYRARLTPMHSVDRDYAREVITYLDSRQKWLKEKLGTHFVYPADEFFLLADWLVPPADYYDDFPQVENGIGMVRRFLDDFQARKSKLPKRLTKPVKILIVTGTSAGKVFRSEIIPELRYFSGLQCDLLIVENKFYGPSVTVSGLLTAGDIVDAIKEHGQKYNYVLLPPSCLNTDGIFLDDLTLEDVAARCGMPVVRGQISLVDTLLPYLNRKRSKSRVLPKQTNSHGGLFHEYQVESEPSPSEEEALFRNRTIA